MTFLWVRFKPFSAVEVSVENCRNVGHLIEKCKQKLPRLLGSYDPPQIFLSLTDDGLPLDPGDNLPPQNTSRTPMFVSVMDAPTAVSSSKKNGELPLYSNYTLLFKSLATKPRLINVITKSIAPKQITYNSTDKFCTLTSDYLAAIGEPKNDLVLFCRDIFRKQFDFIHKVL